MDYSTVTLPVLERLASQGDEAAAAEIIRRGPGKQLRDDWEATALEYGS